jgi:hypothetical protein
MIGSEIVAIKQRPTKRAADGWARCSFSSIFLASSFFLPVERISASHPPVTQTVGLHNHNESKPNKR